MVSLLINIAESNRRQVTFESDYTALATLDAYRLVNGFIALELVTGRALGPDKTLLASQDQHGSVHQVEVILGDVVAVQGIGVRVEMARPLGSQELAVVGAQRDCAVVRLPCQVEERIRRALVIRGLDTAASFQAPVTVLHRSHVPPFRHPIELQLERLMTGDLVLIGSYVDTWVKYGFSES